MVPPEEGAGMSAQEKSGMEGMMQMMWRCVARASGRSYSRPSETGRLFKMQSFKRVLCVSGPGCRRVTVIDVEKCLRAVCEMVRAVPRAPLCRRT